MFGLSTEEWRNLVLSVNTHRGKRRLSPAEVARLLNCALNHTDVASLAEALGFSETTTIRRIERLNSLPADLASLVDWGARRGHVSMSTASELLRLEASQSVREAVSAAIEHNFSRDEARQLIQIHQRSSEPIDECIRRVLSTRPKIERSELIIGLLLTERARSIASYWGDETLTRKLKLALARTFPDVVVRTVKVSNGRFSLLFDENAAAAFRSALGEKSIEAAITDLVEAIVSR